MFSPEDYDQYLKLSPKNPAFIRDFTYRVNELTRALENKEITREQFDEVRDALFERRDGFKRLLPLNSTFVWFLKRKAHGYVNLSFNREEFDALIAARQSSYEFYQWANETSRGRWDNPYTYEYLNALTQKVIAAYKEHSEEFWDLFHELKWDLIRCFARGIITRSKSQPIAKMVSFFLGIELEAIKAVPIRTVSRMAFFAEAPKEIEFDVDSEVVRLLRLYITDLDAYNVASRDALARLRDHLSRNNIPVHQANQYESELDVAISAVAKQADGPVYEPIVTYYYAKELGRDLISCNVYNEKQILDAMKVGSDLFLTLTDKYLINEMILKKLNTDLNLFDNAKNVKEMLYSSLIHDLELLKDHNIISLANYVEFENRGKEKFT